MKYNLLMDIRGPLRNARHNRPLCLIDRLARAGKAGEANGGGIAGGKAAIEAELQALRQEALTPGSWLNDILTKKV